MEENKMRCPFCNNQTPNGKFCLHCGKPLHPKWYQKNSPLTILILIGSLVFLGWVIFTIVSM